MGEKAADVSAQLTVLLALVVITERCSALAIVNTPLLPVAAQENGIADVLGVTSISLKDLVQLNLGFQGACTL